MCEAGQVTVWLLVGLTGSGKTTFASRLVARGVVRLSVDEEVFAQHGRYGIDYHESEWPKKEAPVVEEIYRRLVGLVEADRDVVLDAALWRRTERDKVKELVEAAGGTWRLIYFDVSRDELLRRLAERNRREDANALLVTPEALDDFIARFEVPSGEGEELLSETL
ncbi:AAA family ATPase [Cryptosporangium sp. NPDC048952]|uniref:AAA family ATPase n=1 Tax=Cryptosporangium sp. NPDC048952 TaxID=3363961 RepID=UPI0037194191